MLRYCTPRVDFCLFICSVNWLIENIYVVIGNSVIAQIGEFARVSIQDAMDTRK